MATTRHRFELEVDCEPETAEAVLRIFNTSITQVLGIAGAVPAKPATVREVKATKTKRK